MTFHCDVVRRVWVFPSERKMQVSQSILLDVQFFLGEPRRGQRVLDLLAVVLDELVEHKVRELPKANRLLLLITLNEVIKYWYFFP